MAVLAIALIGMAGAANYMYEKASVKGVGYKNVEMIVSTQTGFNGANLVEKESGSGNVITERTEIEAERQLDREYRTLYREWKDLYPAGIWSMDYINFTKELLPLVSNSHPGALPIFSQAKVFSCFLEAGNSLTKMIEANWGAYLYLLEGGPVEVNDLALSVHGAAMIRDQEKIDIAGQKDAELLLVDVML